MLQIERLDGCYQHTAEPDQATCVEVIMASAVHATNPPIVKGCMMCGEKVKDPRGLYCSHGCANRARTDHSDDTLMRRFWAKVDQSPGHGPQGECWHWTARIDGHGYGEIKVAGRYKKAHRLALFGPAGLDNPMFACHRCDNPQCVRPDHLFPGKSIDNVRDMHAKGRRPSSSPTRGPTARKLTADQVREIRATGISNRLGAAKYGVSPYTINQVRRRALYKDIK